MTGVAVLLRAFIRRDRWFVLWWALGAALLYVSQAWSVEATYRTQAELDRAAALAEGNAAFIAMLGPARALDTVGGQVTWQSTAFGAIVAGLMSAFLLGRHTRAEEESGRDELIRSAPVDRLAPMTAALLCALLANAVLGLAVSASLVAYGLAVADSVSLGVGLMLCGWFFSGTGLVAMQLTASTRGAYGLAGVVIGVAYGLRAVGDISLAALSWASPIGWYQGMHAFSGLRWWPVLPLLLAAVAATASAYALFQRRDFGAGLLPTPAGPARAGPRLASGWGIAWRLQRPAVGAWALGLLVTGATFGTMGEDVGDLVGDSSLSRDMMLQGLDDVVDAFYATSLVMLALVASGFAISSALRPHAEEESDRVEVLLGTALSRRRWLGGHVAVTAAGTVATLAAAGLGLGVTYAVVAGDPGSILRLSLPALQFVPAVLVLSGVARLLHGVAPALSQLSWLGLVLCTGVLFFGEVWRLPQWFQDLSPFEHLAFVPAESFRWAPFLVLAALAALLSVAGQLAFQRRDIH